MSHVVHSDEYKSLDTALTALEEYMVKLSQQLATLTSRVEKLEEAA